MGNEAFILNPGIWNGQGKVSFSSSPDQIQFFTQWDIQEKQGNLIRATQRVEMQGADETLVNAFVFALVTPTTFMIELSNELLGVVKGTGIIDAMQVAWEFRGHATFEGFEVYRLDEKSDFHFHAEYASPDQYRTLIDGRLWRRVEG